MVFLFSSDFHSREAAFTDFAETLKHGPYAAGILAGDLLDEWLPEEQVSLWAEPHPAETRLARALEFRQIHLRTLLETAEKPIYFVLGNHDVTPWPDSDWLTNLHARAVDFKGQRLVGYRWTRMDRYPHELEADVPDLAALVDDMTLLVTHSPPWGVLDGLPGARFRFGLKTLHRLPPARFHLFGHVHECPGVQGRAVNGSWPALRQFFAIDTDHGTATPVAPRKGAP